MENNLNEMPPRKQRIKSEEKKLTKMEMLMISSFTWFYGNLLFTFYALEGSPTWLNVTFIISYIIMSIVLAELINKIKMPLWTKWIVNLLFYAVGAYLFIS